MRIHSTLIVYGVILFSHSPHCDLGIYKLKVSEAYNNRGDATDEQQLNLANREAPRVF